MEHSPRIYPPPPDATDKREQERYQHWMRQEQEHRPVQASADAVAQPNSPKMTQQGQTHTQGELQGRKRPLGAPGTNSHSAHAGISVHNALLELGPPPPDAKVGSKHLPWLRLTDWEMMNLRKRMKKNAKWRPSDDMIRKELAETGRGPRDYAKAKDEAMSRGIEFVDEDGVEVQGVNRKRSLLDQPLLELNQGMKHNQAKKRKRGAHLPLLDGRRPEVSALALVVKQKNQSGAHHAYNVATRVPSLYPENVSPPESAQSSDASSKGHESAIQFSEARKHLDEAGDQILRVSTTSETNMKSQTASAAHAKVVVRIDVTEVSSTRFDGKNSTSTEGHEKSALSMKIDGSRSSKSDESSAESTLGDDFGPPPAKKSSDKPPFSYDLGLDDGFENVDDSVTRIIPDGGQSLTVASATSRDDGSPSKLGFTRVVSSRREDSDHGCTPTPKDSMRAVLVNPATTYKLPHGPVSSSTPLDKQAWEIINAAATEAAEAGGPVGIDTAKKHIQNSPSNFTVPAAPPTNQTGDNRSPKAPKEAMTRLRRPTLSKSRSVKSNDIAPTKPMLHGPETSRTAQGQHRIILKQTIESAVAKAKELGDPLYGHAVQKIYEQSLRNPTIADLLVAVLIRKPLPAQSAEFASRIKAARNKYRELLVPQNLSSRASAHVLSSSDPLLVSGHSVSMHCNNLTTTSRKSSSSSASAEAPVATSRATSALDNMQSLSSSKSPNPPGPIDSQTRVSIDVEKNIGRVASNTSPATNRISSTPSVSTAASVAASSVKSDSSNNQSPSTDKCTNSANPTTLPPPLTPIVPIGVPGGSGVMAWNRARRRARMSATANGNADVRSHASETSDVKHLRLRDFVVNGRVT